MATIEERIAKDGSVSYRVKIRPEGQAATTGTFQRKTDAKKWVQETETAIREGRYFNKNEARRHPLAEAIDRYLRDCLTQQESG